MRKGTRKSCCWFEGGGNQVTRNAGPFEAESGHRLTASRKQDPKSSNSNELHPANNLKVWKWILAQSLWIRDPPGSSLGFSPEHRTTHSLDRLHLQNCELINRCSW